MMLNYMARAVETARWGNLWFQQSAFADKLHSKYLQQSSEQNAMRKLSTKVDCWRKASPACHFNGS